MDNFLWGAMKNELFRPGRTYETRAELVDAIMELENQFNDPNNHFHIALENAFLGSIENENGTRRGGKNNKLPFLKLKSVQHEICPIFGSEIST